MPMEYPSPFKLIARDELIFWWFYLPHIKTLIEYENILCWP